MDLSDFYGEENQPIKVKEAVTSSNCTWRYQVPTRNFSKIPGSPIAYQLLPKKTLGIFDSSRSLSTLADVKEGLNTGDNDKFLRHWAEVNYSTIGFRCASAQDAEESGKSWFPCNKGGPFRKWYGNNEFLVLWKEGGVSIKNFRDKKGRVLSAVRNVRFYFREGLTWSGVGSSGFRNYPRTVVMLMWDFDLRHSAVGGPAADTSSRPQANWISPR